MALPEYLRSLVDLRQFILDQRDQLAAQAPPSTTPDERLAKIVLRELWLDSLKTIPFDEQIVAPLEDCVRIETPGDVLVVDGARVYPAPGYASRGAAHVAPGLFSCELYALHEIAHFFDKRRLPEHAASAFMLAGWVAYDGRTDRYLRPYEVRFGFDYTFVEITYRRAAHAPIVFYWYLPDWNTLDFLLFANAWARYLSALGETTQTTELDDVAKHFIDIVLSIGERRAHDRAATDMLDWQGLANRAIQVVDVPGSTMTKSRRDVIEYWILSRMGLLAAPESGLSAAQANAWLAALRSAFSNREGRSVEERLRETRSERAREALIGRAQQDDERIPPKDVPDLDKRVADLLAEIDAACPDHSWASQIGRDAGSDFVEEAKKVYIAHQPSSGIATPRNLSGYIIGDRTEAILSAAPPVRSALGQALVESENTRLGTSQPASPRLTAVWNRAVAEAQRHDLANVWIPGSQEGRERVAVFQGTPTSSGPESGSAPAVSVLPAPSIELRVDGKPLTPPYLDALYRLRWDVMVDEQDVDTAPAYTLGASWLGVSVWLPSAQYRSSWPAVRWPALFDWELLGECWRSLTPALAQQSSDGSTLEMGRGAVDTLAYQYLTAQVSIAETRTMPPLKTSAPTPAEWDALLKRVLAFNADTRTSVRISAVREWVARAFSIAAPECGLSTTAAATILAASSSLSNADLVAARRTAICETGMGPPEADSMAARIDEGFPGHPWIGRLDESPPATLAQ
jgi:hypothetical protein